LVADEDGETESHDLWTFSVQPFENRAVDGRRTQQPVPGAAQILDVCAVARADHGMRGDDGRTLIHVRRLHGPPAQGHRDVRAC